MYTLVDVYVLFGVGRLCCSFQHFGQCESLYIVERVRRHRLHVLFVCVKTI